ncbi:MAG TPA: PKD domain-containing protein, partial [Chitinophagales bacterium]|nr:PKD domain-containing protein [Chitinophagales bacterium]
MKAGFARIIFSAVCGAFTAELHAQCSVSLSGSASVCLGASTTLTATPAGFSGTPAYVWSPSGSGSSSTVSPSTTTIYSVTASDGTCSAVASVTVTVNPNPAASFTFTNNNACAGTSVSFTSSASGGQPPYSYAWNFGGAGSSAQANPSFSFNPPAGSGTQAYNVTLTVTDSKGCSATATQNVNVSRKPDASIQDQDPFSPWTFCDSTGGTILVIDNTSSTQASNTNYNINWGDGSPPYNGSTLPNGTSHTYSAQGYFTIVLTVTGSNGCTATRTYSVFVGGNPEIGLANPGGTVNACVSRSFTFPITNFSNNPPGTTYTVTVNDGTTPVVYQHPPPSSYTHNFTISSCGYTSLGGFANAFHVRIVADNPCGTTAALVEPIRLGSPPVADFTYTPQVCSGSTIVFTSTSQGNYNNNGVCTSTLVGNWNITPASGWTLTSGSLASSSPISVNFSQPGTYNVQLIVSNPCGTDTTVKPVCVAPAPDADFSVPSLSGCAPLNVPINNISNTVGACGNTTYAWAVTHNGSLCSSGGN